MAESFRSVQVNPPAKEILQEEGEVHEVPERGVFELHKYVDVAFFRLFSSDKRAEEAYAAHSEPVLDLLLVASKDLDDVQQSTSVSMPMLVTSLITMMSIDLDIFTMQSNSAIDHRC